MGDVPPQEGYGVGPSKKSEHIPMKKMALPNLVILVVF